MHDRLTHIDRVLRADNDVTELARDALAGRVRVGTVERKGEHVGRPVLATVLAVERRHAGRINELHRHVTIAHAGGGKSQGTQALRLPLWERTGEQSRAEHLHLEHRPRRLQALRSANR